MTAATLTSDEQLHWLALKLVPGLGPRRSRQLTDQYRTPQAIFRASPSELEACGISGSVARTIASGCTFEDAVDQHQRMLDYDTTLIPITDDRYPPRLREIFDPPVVLFARGRIDLLQSLMLGIVGTRRPPPTESAQLSGCLHRIRLRCTPAHYRGGVPFWLKNKSSESVWPVAVRSGRGILDQALVMKYSKSR
jgi:hypothetical protein